MKVNLKTVGTVVATASLAVVINRSIRARKSAKTKTPFVLEEATIDEMQQALHAGKITSKQLTHMYLDRIEKYDVQAPRINSILEVNPDALKIAEELDKTRSENPGPLYGIPIILKDNINTGDTMHTTAGSVALAKNIASEDAFVARKLREAGAIILGKANLSEFANFLTYDMPNGYSSLGGQVLNPYGPDSFDVGGSSSGSGASIAANLAAAAIGTETSGSILSPASSNSLVGIKPTLGLVSRSGIIPLAHSQDTAGPMTRTVTDAAIMLSAIVGVDEHDEITKTSQGQPTDYRVFLKKNGLKGKRIGIDRSFLPSHDEEVAIVDAAIKDMKKKGAIIVDITIPQQEFESNVLFHEFKHDLNAYLTSVSEDVPVRSLSDIIEYNDEHADVALKYGQTILIESQAMSDDPKDPTYLEHRAKDYQLSATEGIDKVMKENKLDALLFANNWGAEMPAKAGYPSITIPGGYTTEGKPVGVTFSAMAFSEPKLIELAYSYEQATKHRVAPKLD